ncbi:e145faad-ac33-4e1a-af11-d67c1510f174 [Sclerotinia trifoliorum]|uniref:E145faad-ac33-4e1a-af11-d67c1510f174 n=1 Tax=Sclerotinia trifoliorum TaxID=28548 RepID=A0A8H2ZVM5_9HELO|nr:e145faad-ac33-4e1a-af11-d67c1510f174 [Sclerotinia trifoliorum]
MVAVGVGRGGLNHRQECQRHLLLAQTYWVTQHDAYLKQWQGARHSTMKCSRSKSLGEHPYHSLFHTAHQDKQSHATSLCFPDHA